MAFHYNIDTKSTVTAMKLANHGRISRRTTSDGEVLRSNSTRSESSRKLYIMFLLWMPVFVMISLFLFRVKDSVLYEEEEFQHFQTFPGSNETFRNSSMSVTGILKPKNASQVSSDGSLRYLVMHIGPPKTGTTSLQQSAKSDDYFKNAPKYNWTYMRVLRHGFRAPFKENWVDLFESSFARDLKGFQGSAIYSNEVFGRLMLHESNETWNHFKNVTYEKLGFDRIRIVVTYRRFFHWLPSMYSQENIVLLTKWNHEIKDEDEEKLFIAYSLKDFLAINMKNKLVLEKYFDGESYGLVHPTETLSRFYSNLFNDVTIFNMHDPRYDNSSKSVKYCLPGQCVNLNARFYCSALPRGTADALCTYAREHPPIQQYRPRVNLNYSILAEVAAKHNLISSAKHEKRKVVLTIQSYHRNTLRLSPNDFPLICLNENELDELLKISLNFEERLLPEFYASTNGKSEHIQKFHDAVNEKQFCTINAEEVLKNETWKEFFRDFAKYETLVY